MTYFDIVIVNWNSGTQLHECIDSVNRSIFKNCKLNSIIIVDNNSVDDSLVLLKNGPNKLLILKNVENLGFGKACNQGADYASSEYILFLNPDVLIFEDTFTNLFNNVNKNEDKDISVYGVQLKDLHGNIQKNCARIPMFSTFIIRSLGLNKINPKVFKSYTMEDWDHSETQIVDQVMGAFFMIKRSVFEELDGFDERFFVYYEELDLSKRVRDSGYKTLFIAEAQAYHKSGGTSEQIKAKRLFYNTRSRIIYSIKHFGLIKGLFLLIFTFIVEPCSRTLYLLLKGNYSDIFENFKGFGMLFMDSFNIIKLGLKK